MSSYGLRKPIASATSLGIIPSFSRSFRRITSQRKLCLYLENTEVWTFPFLDLINFPSLINSISLLSVVLRILTRFLYYGTDITCVYCGPEFSIQFRAASCLLIYCDAGTSRASIVPLQPPSSWLLSFSTMSQYYHFITNSSSYPFYLSLSSSLMPFFPSILSYVAAWCFFTDFLFSIILTGISTLHDVIDRYQCYNKFVRGVQGKNPSSFRNLGFHISNSLLTSSTYS